MARDESIGSADRRPHPLEERLETPSFESISPCKWHRFNVFQKFGKDVFKGLILRRKH
jgi:hypothetical protein